MEKTTLRIMPDDVTVQIEKGSNLLKACADAGFAVDSPCGGRGTCKKCKVVIDGQTVLACAAVVEDDMVVHIPESSRIKGQNVLLGQSKKGSVAEQKCFLPVDPLGKKVPLTLDRPSLDDSLDDLSRLRLALKKQAGLDKVYVSVNVVRRLPDVLRAGDFSVNATIVFDGMRWEMVDIEPGVPQHPPYGLAVDIGTTTIAAYLVDLDTGKLIDKAGAYNRQSLYGSDVIARVVYTEENGGEGIEALQRAAVGTVNELVEQMVSRLDISPQDIKVAVCAGNTVMTHMLLGVTAQYLRLEPYTPAAINFSSARARHIGLAINKDAPVHTVPSVASYVGGDITAGILVSGMHEEHEKIELFIDIGTNGELVLGNAQWMMTCACSAGPAFEGSGISCGMRALDGAIDSIEVDGESNDIRVHTIGGAVPIGISGSGLIDVLCKLLLTGYIDRGGKIDIKGGFERVAETDDGDVKIILARQNEYGEHKEVFITESDIKNLLRAKGAIFAGIRVMLDNANLPMDAIDRIIIAGGFGNSIQLEAAIEIGLLPDLPLEKYTYIGNSSVTGALAVLLDRQNIAVCRKIASGMTYLELSIGNQFMEEFVSAMFIPHTDLSLFPHRDTARGKG